MCSQTQHYKLKHFKEGQSICAYCGTKLFNRNCHVEHVIHRSKGGSSRIKNLVLACSRCNAYKSSYLLDEFAKQVKLKRDSFYYRTIRFLSRAHNSKRRNDIDDFIRFTDKVLSSYREFKYFHRIFISTQKMIHG